MWAVLQNLSSEIRGSSSAGAGNGDNLLYSLLVCSGSGVGMILTLRSHLFRIPSRRKSVRVFPVDIFRWSCAEMFVDSFMGSSAEEGPGFCLDF